MSMGPRIRERLSAIGRNQADLARAIGVSPQAISKLVQGGTAETPKLYQIARFLETTPEYLSGESDDPDLTSVVLHRRSPPKPVPANDNVEVHEIDLAYGMGGTYLDGPEPQASTMSFPRAFLRNFTKAAPDQLFFARGHGDSMMPTISDADIVLIDRSQDTMRMRDQIWAVAVGGVGMIKRLRPMADGSVTILSDNPAVPEDRAVDGEMHLIGRVVAIVRRV